MKLLTKAIATKLHKADIANLPPSTAKDIVVKFFAPWGSATWYIVSGTPLDSINGEPCGPENAKDWHLFGFCDLGDRMNAELGYVLLSQLQAIRGQFGLRVERDMYYSRHTLSEVMGVSRL